MLPTSALSAIGAAVALAVAAAPSLAGAATGSLDLDVRAEVATEAVEGLATARDGDGRPVVAHDQAAGAHDDPAAEPDHDHDHDHEGEGEESHGAAGGVLSAPTEMPMAFSLVGFSVPDGAAMSVRHRLEDGDWSEWEPIHLNPEEAPDADSPEPSATDERGRVATLPVWTGPADQLQLRVDGAAPEDVAVHLVDGLGQERGVAQRLSDAAAAVARTVTPPGRAAVAAVSQPDITSRSEWDAQPSGTPSYASSARGAVLHHTVTSNDYSPSQSPAVVRSIQSYHQDHLGWNDIGYNFLVDRYGQIYQGRAGGITEAVVGAHAAGHNTGSIGVAFLGQHHSGASPAYQPVNTAAAEAAVDLLAWLFDVHGIDAQATATLPSGYTYPSWAHQMVGHGSLGQTSCPGSSVNDTLPVLRDGVVAAQRADDGSDDAADDGDDGDSDGGEADRRGAESPDEGELAALERLAGPSRKATAVAVSRFARDEADQVVIASASAYPDALAAAGLAGQLDAPVLLSARADLDDITAAEIERLGAVRAVVVGGEAAVGPQVESTLADRGVKVQRIAGADRFATAARVADHLDGADSVLVANGIEGWPDAVAASQLAAAEQAPVLLTEADELPQPTREAVADADADEIVVVGGSGVISSAVADQLAHDGTLTRLAGPDRVHTAALVADRAADADADAGQVWLASAADWPDALAAGPGAARTGHVLVLTWPASFDADGPVAHRVAAADHVRLVGGSAAISAEVEHRIAEVLAR